MDGRSSTPHNPLPNYNSDSSSPQTAVSRTPPSTELNFDNTMSMSEEQMNNIVAMVQNQLATLEQKVHARFNSKFPCA